MEKVTEHQVIDALTQYQLFRYPDIDTTYDSQYKYVERVGVTKMMLYTMADGCMLILDNKCPPSIYKLLQIVAQGQKQIDELGYIS